MEFIDSIWFIVLLGVAGWVLIYVKTEQQKGGSMQLRKFLSKNTPKKDKIRILEKMLKVKEVDPILVQNLMVVLLALKKQEK